MGVYIWGLPVHRKYLLDVFAKQPLVVSMAAAILDSMELINGSRSIAASWTLCNPPKKLCQDFLAVTPRCHLVDRKHRDV